MCGRATGHGGGVLVEDGKRGTLQLYKWQRDLQAGPDFPRLLPVHSGHDRPK